MFTAGTGITCETTADGTVTITSTALPLAGGTMTGNIVMGDDTSIGIADDAERIEFDGAGDISLLGCNVGIGAIDGAPFGKLEVAQDTAFTTTYTDSVDNIVLTRDATEGDDAYGGSIGFASIDSPNQRMAAIASVQTGSDSNLIGISFFSHPSSTGGDPIVEAMRIEADGKVGIGTTTPTATLEVDGNIIAKTDTDTSNTGTVDLNFATNQNFVLTLTGNITSLTASNEVVGQSGFIVFIQDGTGGRTVALHGDYETAAGAGLTLTSTASATDIVPYVVAASSRILLGTPQLAFA